MLTAMRDQTLLEPAGRDRLAALERQVISEWTSARLALSTVIPDWSARIKTGIFAGSERSQQKKLAQEAVALIERREDHLGREGETSPPTVSEDQLHPWVWSAARATWSSGHYRHAASDAVEAVEAVTTKLKERINFTGPSSAAYTAAFAESSPKAGNPRLHLRPFEEHRVDLRLVGIRDHRPQARGPRLRRVVEASCVDDHRTHPTRDHRCHQPIAAPAAHRPRPTPQTIPNR